MVQSVPIPSRLLAAPLFTSRNPGAGFTQKICSGFRDCRSGGCGFESRPRRFRVIGGKQKAIERETPHTARVRKANACRLASTRLPSIYITHSNVYITGDGNRV